MRCAVRSTHLECVEGDHNKYYRLHLVAGDGLDGPHRLVRNWGRRGAPRGQWLVDPARGAAATERATATIVTEKTHSKRYVRIRDCEFDIDGVTTTYPLWTGHSGTLTDALTDGFERSWAEVALTELAEGDGGAHVALFSPWESMLHGRAAARAVLDGLDGAIVHHDRVHDRGVIAFDGNIDALATAFGPPVDIAAGSVDDAETLLVALRLYTGGSGPYGRLETAVRDARRLFRRTGSTLSVTT